MPNQSRPQSPALAFDRDEWELLVTLPRRVLLTATPAEAADGRSSPQGIAGLEAIASGLASESPLVREVVGSIYAESHHEPPELFGDGEATALETLAACRYASELLAARCDDADASAYRDWLTRIAEVVVGAGHSRGVDASSGRVALVESRFLYALGGVLRP
jgi:hypothetical protein